MWKRTPIVAGSFYPSSPARIRNDIDQYLREAVGERVSGEIIGLVSPHAGYIYSGPVAAYSYKQLVDQDVDVVVVLAPSHRLRFKGASVIPSGIYETPLGDVEIDEVLGHALAEERHFEFIKDAHQYEHSLEVQVPFLQKVLKEFKIVPIIIGSSDLAICREIAAELVNHLKKEKRRFVLVISTDLSHYYPYKQASEIDHVFIEALKSFDENRLGSELSCEKAQACGAGPVLTGLMASRALGAHRVEILKYANSGDTAGGKDEVVGYLAAAFVK